MIIYKITNNINGKKYVGQHCGNSESRWKQHLAQAFNKENPYPLYRAMRKYGMENFTYEVLEEVPLELGQKQLDLREIFHIHNENSFISHKQGYNQTLGGGGQMVAFCKVKESGKRKDLYDWAQYDKDGNLIKVWNNIQDAANELSVNYHHIHHAADWHIEKGKYGKTSGGFMWVRIPNDSQAPKKIKSSKELGTKKAKKIKARPMSIGASNPDYEIGQYDIFGNLVQIWPNNAEHIFRTANYDSDAVKRNLRGDSIFTYGYMWRRFLKGQSPEKIIAPSDTSGLSIDYNQFYDEPILEKDASGEFSIKHESVSHLKKPFMVQVRIYDSIFNEKNYEHFIPEKEFLN
jgi:group I intron endonuclease